MNSHSYWLKCVLIALLFLGCGKSNPVLPDPDQFVQDFEALWKNFDQTYSYFEYKDIDWQTIHDEFRPQADQVTQDGQLIELLKTMLAPLRDFHVFLKTPNGAFVPTYTSPHAANWNKEVWLQQVSNIGWHQMVSNWGYGTIQSLPYIAIGSWGTGQVKIDEFDSVLEIFKDSPGLILDVRANGGGNDALAFQVASRFTKEERIAEYIEIRNGPSHSDFTPLAPRTVSPRGAWQFDKPVALLIGRICLSSNESFISAMREIPHVTLIGDTTGGSSGNPTFFKLSNNWEYSVPRWIAYTADTTGIEWNGIPPDINVTVSPNDFANGIDPVLDFAITWLNEQIGVKGNHQ